MGRIWFEQAGQDLHYTFRTLRKSAGFTSTAILNLAPEIRANTAIFQLLDAVRLRSLPVPAPQSLALVQTTFSQRAGTSADQHVDI